ncbi:MAG TPA: hypothetical protein VEC12_10645, partial [Bacteroidia bacterium]|nr:hypothetical protein [Bacteroidia bacterium]
MRKLTLSLTFLLFTFSAFSQLSGVKTIDPAGSGPNNYASFTAAVSALTSSGVNGPVLFQVAAGTYNQQVDIPAISGANATNTITFDGGFGNADTRILAYTATSTTNAFVVRFNNASYVTFKNITIKNNGTGTGNGVTFYSGANNCAIIRCNVLVDSTSTSSNFKAIHWTGSTSVTDGGDCGGTNASGFGIVIDSCEVVGGYFNFYASSGYHNSSLPHSMFVRANRFRKAYSRAFGIASVRGYQINYNYIDMSTSNNGSYGMWHCNGGTSGAQAYEIIGNTWVNCGQAGIVTNSRNNGGARSKIWNNVFLGTWRSASAQAIQLNHDANNDIWGNTIIMQNALNTNGAGIYFGSSGYLSDLQNNNILLTDPASQGLAVNAPSGSVAGSDYNNFYKVNSGPGQFLVVMNGTQLTKNNFRGFSGFDAHSYSEDPILVSATNVRPLSACLRGNYQSANSVDIYGTSRLNPPTVGAAESAGGFGLDVATDAFLKPVFPIPSGNNDVEVVIKNKGTNTITSLDINVQLGSVTRTINWTGSLAACDDTTILFTGSNQLSIGPGQNTIKAWVSNPNNDTDENHSNDTISQGFCAPFAAGTYTIDPAGSGPNNYTTIKQVTEIMNCGGIAGPVTFNLAATTFNETIDLLFVKG